MRLIFKHSLVTICAGGLTFFISKTVEMQDWQKLLQNSKIFIGNHEHMTYNS